MNDSQVAQIRQEVIDLAPWHIEVEIAPGITSAIGKDVGGSIKGAAPKIGWINPKEGFLRTLRTIYPNGLENRSFLDCGCNCGAYCFWAKELGAGRTVGVDPRGHWIQQARLIQKYREMPLLEFHEMDLDEFSARPMPRFDITLFKGLLHLVPDPVRTLKIAADRPLQRLPQPPRLRHAAGARHSGSISESVKTHRKAREKSAGGPPIWRTMHP